MQNAPARTQSPVYCIKILGIILILFSLLLFSILFHVYMTGMGDILFLLRSTGTCLLIFLSGAGLFLVKKWGLLLFSLMTVLFVFLDSDTHAFFKMFSGIHSDWRATVPIIFTKLIGLAFLGAFVSFFWRKFR